MFRNNERNRRPYLTLKVGHRHLYNEGNFLWRRIEQSCDSTHFVIKIYFMIFFFAVLIEYVLKVLIHIDKTLN